MKMGEEEVEQAQHDFFLNVAKMPKNFKKIFCKNWVEPAQPVFFENCLKNIKKSSRQILG